MAEVPYYGTSYEDFDYTPSTTGNPHFRIMAVTDTVNTEPGATISIDVTVENDGDADGDVTIELRDHNDVLQDSRTVTIPAGDNASVTLNGTAPSAEGIYNYHVKAYNVATSTYDDDKTVTVNVSGEGGGGTGGELGFNCYELARLMLMGQLTKILRGEQIDLSGIVNILVSCKMLEVLQSSL